MGIVAVGAFAIPVGILGDGFADWVSEKYSGDEEEEEVEEVAVKRDLSASLTGKIYAFLEGETWLGGWFQTVQFLLIFASLTQTALETVPSVDKEYGWVLSGVEQVCVYTFAAEYLLRLCSAAQNPEFSNWGWKAPFGFVLSFYSIIDLLAIAPYFWTLAFPGGKVDDYDEMLRMFRVLRLLKVIQRSHPCPRGVWVSDACWAPPADGQVCPEHHAHRRRLPRQRRAPRRHRCVCSDRPDAQAMHAYRSVGLVRRQGRSPRCSGSSSPPCCGWRSRATLWFPAATASRRLRVSRTCRARCPTR